MPRKQAANVTSATLPKKTSAKVLQSRVVYRGPVFYVTSDQVREPSGVTARRDVIRHSGSVVVMAVDDTRQKPRVLLIRQYRYAAGRYLWEFPAGRVDEGEQTLAGAKRELMEETGITAKNWKQAMFFYVSPGFLNETMALYLARGLTRGTANPEEDEVIEARFFPVSVAARMATSGRIQDAKTIAGALWLEKFYSGR